MKLSKRDIQQILSNYNLGNLKSFEPIERRLNTLNHSLIINTTKGKFFLKIYTKQFKRFKYHILKGLELLIFLEKKKYPSIKVIISKDRKPYIEYKTVTFAIFEFLNIKEKRIINKEEAYELGKSLGKLHKLSKNFPLNRTGQGYSSFKRELNKNFYLSKKAPRIYKEALTYVKKYFSMIEVPSTQPKSVCHVEFTHEHVQFKGNKLIKVIDWDEISKDYLFYDLGTTMVEAFTKNSVNFNILSSIIKGYESQRKLTDWEREHLFEALLFGICKFVIWGLDKEEIRKSGWGKIGLQSVNILRKIGKDKFNFNLKKEVLKELRT
jgi:Ser/Thr protein kinase RdoA (MazF antagonist)